MHYGLDSDRSVNEPPNIGTSRIQLTPLALAILMGCDDNVSTLLNAQPNMLAYRETVYPVEDKQEEKLEEMELIRAEMGDESANSEVENLEEQSAGDAAIEKLDSAEYRTVSDGVTIEAMKLADSHNNAQANKLVLIQWDRNPLPSQHCLLYDAGMRSCRECRHTHQLWRRYRRDDPLLSSHALGSDRCGQRRHRENGDSDPPTRERGRSAEDKNSKTAMHYAAGNNRLDIVRRQG